MSFHYVQSLCQLGGDFFPLPRVCVFVVRMSNHEKSKKHRELVAILKAQLEEEEDGLELQVSFTIPSSVVLKAEMRM